MLFMFAIIAYVILSWLIATGSVDRRNPMPFQIYDFLHRFIEPIARPIRKIIPPIGQLDLSIIVILLSIPFLNEWLIPRLILMEPF